LIWCGSSPVEKMNRKPSSYTQRIKRMNQRFLVRMRRFLPPGTRWVVGLMLIIGGIFGFLPVLGFWMIPLGLGVAALDIKPIIQWLRGLRGGSRK
jgi:hypothetical protein